MKRSKEVADIFRKFGAGYRDTYGSQMSRGQLRAMRAIEICRTAELGGHVDRCDRCGHERISYNSCRNRHCPKCQRLAKEKWISARKKDLLPVKYFHIVVTIPDILNNLTLVNKAVIYDILFKSASESLQVLGKDPNHLGAEIGLIAVLHTWGQNLIDHPHLHCIIPGGGLSADGNKWVFAKDNFFISVKVLSRLFRGKFLYCLKKAYNEKKLEFAGRVEYLKNEKDFQRMINDLYKKEWVVYCKPPFKSPQYVLEYLGRYTHRIAISNNRIETIEEDKIIFRWRDYKDSNKNKLMTLDAFEFIRRFLLHILPDKFVKIRHYGILGNRNKKTKLQRCKEILNTESSEEHNNKESNNWQDLLFQLTGIDYRICPSCAKGNMILKETLQPVIHGPP